MYFLLRKKIKFIKKGFDKKLISFFKKIEILPLNYHLILYFVFLHLNFIFGLKFYLF
jgi:hypothetical protein